MASEIMTFVGFWEAQKAWSKETFGPKEHRGPAGPLDHLQKEAEEAATETDPEALKEELADCLFLIIDAAWRAGISRNELIVAAFAKLEKNKQRTWPDWRTADPNKAVEHDRSKDQPNE